LDIWTGHSQRTRECINCSRMIYPGDQVAIGQWKRTYPWGTRTRRVMSHWKCWISLQETYMADHPYEPRRVAGPGRPRKFTDVQRKRRLALNVSISRWNKEHQYYIGLGMWSVASRYSDKVQQARDELNGMVS